MTSPLTRALFALVLTGGLAACDITPARTIWALRSVDPLTTAPEELRLAVRLPQGFRPSFDGMALIAKLEATATQPQQSEQFRISPEDQAQLPSWMHRAGAPLYGFKLAEEDAAKFRLFQRSAARAKAQGRGGEITIGTQVCRLGREMPDQVLVSAFLKTGETKEYVALFEDRDILSGTTPEEIAQHVPLC